VLTRRVKVNRRTLERDSGANELPPKMGILRWSRQAFFITDPIILPDLGSQMLAKQIQALVLRSLSAAFAPGISSGKAPYHQDKTSRDFLMKALVNGWRPLILILRRLLELILPVE